MLVTMTGFLTNTISSCQEFTKATVANARLSNNSAGSKNSFISSSFVVLYLYVHLSRCL